MKDLRLDNFMKYAAPSIIRRGREYWEQGRVDLPESEGHEYVATVHGTQDYTTKAVVKGNEIERFSCNCPYSGTMCKHEVALLLELKERYLKTQETEAPVVAVPDKDSGFKLGNNSLTERELFLCCVLIFDNDKLTSLPFYPIPFFENFKFTAEERSKLLSSLINKDIVYSAPKYWHETVYRVPTPLYYFFLKELVLKHPDWLKFMESKFSRNDSVKYILEITEVLNRKRKKLSNSRSYYSFYDDPEIINSFVKAIVLMENPDKVISLIERDVLYWNLNELASSTIEGETISWLDQILSFLDRLEPKDDSWHICYQHLTLEWFLARGSLLPQPDTKKLSSFAYYLKAIISLYEGHTDEAIASFQKGISLAKKKDFKYIPSELLPALLYTIALGTRRSPSDLEHLRKILDTRKVGTNYEYAPVFALVNFFQSNRQPKGLDTLREVVSSKAYPDLCKSIAALLLAYFNEETSVKNPGAAAAVLQCELSAYGLSDKGPWPYEPVLGRIKLAEPWEMELQELIYNARSHSGISAKDNDGRLVYHASRYYSEYVIAAIKQQRRLKSGDWSKGTIVSSQKYFSEEPAMDAVDKKIHNNWKVGMNRNMYSYDFPSINLIVPFLKGTDKLLLNDRVVNIREEIPYIYTQRENGRIYLKSNIPLDAQEYDNILLNTKKSHDWVYYTISSQAMELVRRIIELKSVPDKAEPMLEQLFEALKGQVEVHSEISGAIEVEKMDSRELLTLRITPESGTYAATIFFRPLKDGNFICFPGSGEPTILDTIGGKRVEVTRKLKNEKKNLDFLNRLIHGRLHTAEFSISCPSVALNLVQMLELMEIKREQADLFEIEWPEGVPLRVTDADPQKWSISATPTGGWFELEGKIPLTDEHIVSMSKLLSLFRESDGRYIRLGEDQFLRLSDSLRKQLKRIDSISQNQGGKLVVSGIALAVSGDSLRGDMDIEEPEVLLQMRQRIKESEQLDIQLPMDLNGSLRDYQEDGVRWMLRMSSWGAGVCLADDMGLGKTIQTITVMLSRRNEGAQMVVAPASVVGNWKREINRFAPSLNVTMLNEVALADRKASISSLSKSDVLVLTYGLLVTECEALCGREWASVCLDEAHTIKNRDTKSSAAAMQLKASCRIILTGTPIQNHLGELWNLIQFINPGLLGSYEHFNEKYIQPIAAGQQGQHTQLKRLIAPFILRRTKQEVARELPDKEDIIVPVTLSEEEMSVYEVLRREAKAELESASSLSVNALAMITKLREAACSASLVEKGLHIASSKLSLMMDKLLQILEQGNRVLIFSQFTSYLDMACEALNEAGIKDYFYLTGSTAVRKRQSMVEEFQAGTNRVFLISLKAGGLGLNLTGANYVIHLDPWWNPAIEQQATDRAYRIGQNQKVTVYHLISEHTIEEKILRLHQTKRSLADSLLEGTDFSHKLSAKELLEMIS